MNNLVPVESHLYGDHVPHAQNVNFDVKYLVWNEYFICCQAGNSVPLVIPALKQFYVSDRKTFLEMFLRVCKNVFSFPLPEETIFRKVVTNMRWFQMKYTWYSMEPVYDTCKKHLV